jgi:sigma-B regulation protein RsbU (phosphoserine phosphatase)
LSDTTLDAFLAALAADDPESLYDRAPCGYLTTTPEGVIAKVNKTFLTLTRYAEADLVGKRRFVDLLTAGGRIYHETHFAPMIQMQGTAREIAFDLVRADGERLPVLVNSVLERDDADLPVAVHTAVFDASQRREYERELLRAKQRAEASEDRARLLSHTLQQSFIPPSHPLIPGLDLATAYQPAGDGAEIGGDFFDVFEVGSDDWCVVIGDVCGKGIEAALVTALARHTIRAAAVRQQQPSAMLHTLNEVLLHHETDRFCTLAVARLCRSSGGWDVTVSCGGHPPPLLLNHSAAPVAIGQPGSLVGVFPAPRFSDSETRLEPGQAIVAYTDGVTEARGAERAFFGEARLTASLSRDWASAKELVDGLLAAVVSFQTGKPTDDLAVMAIAHGPQSD